jgi:hypothetical protein
MSAPPTILLRVKSAREQTAISSLRQARAAAVEAREQLAAKRKAIEEYRAWRPQRERQLYDDILNREVSLGDLEELKGKIVRMREREQSLCEEEDALERALESAEQAEEEAHAVWQAAQREVQKVKELLADWRVRERREVEHQGELELEEFSRPRGMAGH